VNDFDIISVPSFADFVSEVGTAEEVRLCLSSQYEPDRFGTGNSAMVVPARRICLDLQARNGHGQLIWLRQERKIQLASDGPATPQDAAWEKGFIELEKIVSAALSKVGFAVRPGRYVLPPDLRPLSGTFDCAQWHKAEDGTVRVKEGYPDG